ncbi:hypothetical protein C8R45DRAFT_1159701 [Mycena sanguinolenta]|nr:hypothetical protein C8R45DRAFT_1159701 [Mycena sanguinolenta]
MEAETIQDYDGFSKTSDKATITAVGREEWETKTHTVEVYVYLGNPMPGNQPDDEKFVCLGKDAMFKFMRIKDLEERIFWKDGIAPGCYEQDQAGSSGLTLWELEGDRWSISKDSKELWKAWFVRDKDYKQWNNWTTKALEAAKSNSLVGFPKFARFWIPKSPAHYVFEPVDDIYYQALHDSLVVLNNKWKPNTVSWEAVKAGNGNRENNRIQWAAHCLGFYKIWVLHEHYTALLEECGENGRWNFPDDAVAKTMDVQTRYPRHIATPPTLFTDDTQSSTSITKDKMDNASGKRTTVNSQSSVMADAKPGKMYEILHKSDADRLQNGLWPAEWLHRSAYSFGALDGGVSSQTRRNLVLGTSEANTRMILFENAIADYVARTETIGKLVTRVKYPQNWNLPKYTWLAPTLEYEFTLNFGTAKEKTYTANIETFSRRLTNSLEARASYYFLAALFPTAGKDKLG